MHKNWIQRGIHSWNQIKSRLREKLWGGRWIPCGGQSTAEKIDDNDCSEGSVIGGLLGAGIALSSSRGKDRFWAVPAGGTAGALIGCQVDGG